MVLFIPIVINRRCSLRNLGRRRSSVLQSRCDFGKRDDPATCFSHAEGTAGNNQRIWSLRKDAAGNI